MPTDELKEIHSIQLDMLKVIDKICEKYSIRYYAIGGTCLGSIRHKGFIPWDDDIDLGIPRPDYNKFIEVAATELKEDLFLQTYKNDEEYFYGFAKLRNSKTTFIEESLKNLRINHGIYIDIFPLDGIGDKKYFGMFRTFIIKLYHKILCLKMIPEYKLGESFGQAIKKLLVWVPKYRINEKIDRLSSREDYDGSKYVVNYFGSYGKREIVPQFFFGKGIDVEFEGFKIKAPYHYDSYMTSIYGNYMLPPPPEERTNIHNAIEIDCSMPYTRYT